MAGVDGQRPLERIRGALGILGGPASSSPSVTRWPTRASRSASTAASRRSVARGVGPVALARQPPRQPRQRGQIVGRRQQRVAIRLDRLLPSASARSAISPMRTQAALTPFGSDDAAIASRNVAIASAERPISVWTSASRTSAGTDVGSSVTASASTAAASIGSRS